MKLLYINENSLSEVHHNLCTNLQRLGIDVTVAHINRDNVPMPDNSEYKIIEIDPEFNKLRYSLDFKYKIKKKWELISRRIDIQSFDFIFAPTFFSDGAFAYKAFKKYNIKYIVSVRNTDINIYCKFLLHLWMKGMAIADNAKAIIGISPILKDQFFTSIPFKHKKNLIDKFIIVPNGINSYWLNHLNLNKKVGFARNFICVTNFTSNKNVPKLIKSFAEAHKENPNIVLSIVGDGGNEENKVKTLIKSFDFIRYYGRVKDHDELRSIYNQNDAFIMVSHHETFGLVYIEALSQNLPIIYTKGTGIDKILKKNIGIAVNSHSSKEITEAILSMSRDLTQYESISDDIKSYSWEQRALSIFNILNS